jgi:phage shock protein PspC (stress-responsive transcriptional regulator)
MAFEPELHPDRSAPPLRRVRQGRWLAGVCQGLARRWDLNVAQVRALFVLSSVLAGAGVLVYVACWLVLPLDEDRGERPSLVRGLASLALLAAGVAGMTTIAAAASLMTVFGFGWTVALAGGVFLVAALVASPVVRPAWTLAVLAAAVVPAVVVATSGVRVEPQTGLVTHTPSTVADVPKDGYHAGLGDLFVDLRRFEARAGSTVPLRLDTGTGRTVVALPRDRCLNLDIRYRTSKGWPLTRVLGRPAQRGAVFYGDSLPLAGHWRRRSSDPHAATLKIDYTAVVGTLRVRDYPLTTGPLYDPEWPENVASPRSPGAIRWAWRETVHKPSVQRRWRTWRKRMARFRRDRTRMRAGACARHTSPQ